MVVAAPDLDDPAFTSLLNFAHDAGRTVAIVDATQDEADRFARFFGDSGANCAPASGASTIELYGLQESRARKPPLSSSYCLVGLTSLDRSGERSALHWLRQRFAASAPAPTPPEPSAGVAGSNNIVDLATAVHCSFMNNNDPAGQGRIMTEDAYVTGARSFLNSEDIYYVQDELQYTQGRSTDPDYGFQVTRLAPPASSISGAGCRNPSRRPSRNTRTPSPTTPPRRSASRSGSTPPRARAAPSARA